MHDEAYFVAKLTLRHIKPTATRLLIVREMMRGDETVSLPELERLLPTIDKSTISRTLSLFLLHRLIHAIDDGSGALKYAVCADAPCKTSIHIFTASNATAHSALNSCRCPWCRYPTVFG